MKKNKKSTSFHVAVLLGAILIIIIGIFITYIFLNNKETDNENSIENKDTIADEEYDDGNNYENVDINDVINCLKNEGIDKANKKYSHKYIKFTAKFSSLTNDLSYVSVTPQNNNNESILLNTKYTNYEQIENAKKLKKGDKVIVRAYLTEAFEIEDDGYTAYKMELKTINK